MAQHSVVGVDMESSGCYRFHRSGAARSAESAPVPAGRDLGFARCHYPLYARAEAHA